MVDRMSGVDVTDEDPLVPGWLVRLAAVGWRVLVTLALGVVLFSIVQQLAVVAASIILGLILAATLAPYVIERRARGWSRSKAAGVVSLAALLVIGVAIALVVVAFVPSLSAIVSSFDAGLGTLREHLTALGVPSDLVTILQRIGDAIRGHILGALANIVGAAANVVTVAILGGFLTFFLLLDGDRAWDWVLAATDGWRREALMRGGWRALDQVGGYIRGTSIMAAATAILALVVMLLLGVPLAGPLAVVVLFGAFVPYVGRALSAFVIVTVALATRGAVPAVILFALFVIGSIVLDRYLARLTSGRRLELHPILAVVGLPLGFAAGGFSGLVVILPVLAFAQTAAGVLITALGREPTPATATPAAPSPAVAPTAAVAPSAAEESTPPAASAAHPSAASIDDAEIGVSAAVRSGLVPVWLDRLGQWSWRSLVVAALFLVVAQVALLFPAVILPVVMAVILAATLEPAAAALERRGMGRTTAALVVTAGTAVVIIAGVVLTLASLVGPMGDVVATTNDGAQKSGADAVGIGSFVAAVGSGILASVRDAVANIVGIVVILLLGGFLTFYFIRDGGRVWRALTAGVPPASRGLLDTAGTRAVDVLGGYMLGTAAISAFGAASQWVIMVLLGLPYALPLAVLALFAGFIPYVGGFIATALAFLVAVSVGDTTDIVVMFIYTIVFNIVQGNFVTPLVYGKAVSLHPAIVLLAVPIGNALAGIVGMFLVVPVAGVIATTWRAVLQTIEAGGATEPRGAPPRAAPDDALCPRHVR